MKILFAISAPISILLLRGQAAYNKAHGAEVYLATSFDEKFVPLIKQEGFTYKELDIEREISLVKDIKAVRTAIKLLKEIKPDIVNASTPKAGLIFMIACVFTKVKLPIFTLRGLRSHTLSGMKGFIVGSFEWFTCLLAKKVIVIAPSLREYAVSKGIVNRKKTIVIGKGSSNGILVDRFNPDKIAAMETQEQKAEWNMPADGFVFGFVGRIVKDKGIEELYLAFSKIQNPKAYLVLVGEYEPDDPISDQVYAAMKADPQVRFVGFSNNVPLSVSAFDVLVLFSYREGFGNVALEGSCMAKPILVSDIIGLSDTVENGVTGYCIESKNAAALHEKMKLYLNDEALRKEHGTNGRKRVLTHFSSDFIHSELYKIYERELDRLS